MKTRHLVCGLFLALGCATGHATDMPGAKKESEPEAKTAIIKELDVSTAADLVAAVGDGSVNRIVVSGDLTGLPQLRLSPDQTLVGSGPQASVRFKEGSDGIQLSANNKVQNLRLVATSNKRVVFNDTTVTDFGVLELGNLTMTGVVQLLAVDRVRAGRVEVHGIDIVSADSRAYDVRPKGYGVEVVPGAFTLWNQQLDSTVTITADLTGLSAGRPDAPVRGSGIFISGASDTGGRLIVNRLETDAIYSNGGIVQGTADRISGGVFTVHGAFVDIVRTRGPVTTYGPNDMVLDNWGVVDRWISDERISSCGPSAIGFVNFGNINSLRINAPIETFGQGARGFNVYAGTVKSAEFDRIVTHGNGAVGIQIGRPVGEISVRRGVETFGGSGDSLVKGVMTKLSAVAFSIKPEGSVQRLKIAGGLITHGSGIAPLDLQGGVGSLQVKDGIMVSGGKDFSSQ